MKKVREWITCRGCGSQFMDETHEEGYCSSCLYAHYSEYFHRQLMEPRETILRKALRMAVLSVLMAFLGILALPASSFALKGSNSVLSVKTGLASFYSLEACKYNPHPRCPTASGESLYDLIKEEKESGKHFMAVWEIPFGRRVKVTNLANGKSTEAVVKDRGPSRRLKGRIVDLSLEAFRKIADSKEGLIEVEISY